MLRSQMASRTSLWNTDPKNPFLARDATYVSDHIVLFGQFTNQRIKMTIEHTKMLLFI